MRPGLRTVLGSRRPDLATRYRGHPMGGFEGLPCADGVMEAFCGDRAVPEWPNGARWAARVRKLVPLSS